jgi:hypothetical protein
VHVRSSLPTYRRAHFAVLFVLPSLPVDRFRGPAFAHCCRVAWVGAASDVCRPQVDAYMSSLHVPMSIQTEIREYYAYIWARARQYATPCPLC